MAKFDNVVIGDRLWCSRFGWGEVVNFSEEKVYLVFGGGLRTDFYKDGSYISGDKFPILFWNEYHVPTDEEDVKPFDLEPELRKLKVKEFEFGKENYYLLYNKFTKIDYSFFSDVKIPVVYFELESLKEFVARVKDKNITSEQFIKAYNKVFGGNKE